MGKMKKAEAVEGAAQEAEVDAIITDLKTMMGDTRDAFLEVIKGMKGSFDSLPEADQKGIIYSVEGKVRQAIREIVGATMEHSWPSAIVKLEKLEVGDKGLVAKISAQNSSENRVAMGAHVMRECRLVMVDTSEFNGQKAPAETTPDQPTMDLSPAAQAYADQAEAERDEFADDMADA